jgi:hypothetical protein
MYLNVEYRSRTEIVAMILEAMAEQQKKKNMEHFLVMLNKEYLSTIENNLLNI